MEDLNGIQLLVTALLSSGLVGGFITLFTKKIWSPETKNDLARIGNEFAQLLLEEARAEREELRTTIRELETGLITKQETIEKLDKILDEKDLVIGLLEERQYVVARKIASGEVVSLYDIFGPRTPEDFLTGFMPERRKEPRDESEG